MSTVMNARGMVDMAKELTNTYLQNNKCDIEFALEAFVKFFVVVEDVCNAYDTHSTKHDYSELLAKYKVNRSI